MLERNEIKVRDGEPINLVASDMDSHNFVQDRPESNSNNQGSLTNPQPSTNSTPDVRFQVEAEATTPDLPDTLQHVRLIGEGGMSLVFRALDSDGAPVAVKVLREELCRDPSVVERFLREAESTERLQHPNIVKVFRSGTTTKGSPYIVSEFVDGQTLEQVLRAEGALSVQRSINIFKQVCAALRAAHEKSMVHRDIKPSNIIVWVDDDGMEQAKLLDFGIAKPSGRGQFANPDLTRTGLILGSPAYMSPEQCTGSDVDERSDIYSLGCVMYETLTGRSPFSADNPVKAIIRHLEEPPEPFELEHKQRQVPKGLEDVVMSCLEKQPKHRIQRIWQLEEVLNSTVAPALEKRALADLIDVGLITVAIFSFIVHIPDLAFGTPFVWILAASVLFSSYFAAFESSVLEATPGKLLVGIKVRNRRGERLTLNEALTQPLFTSAFVLSSMALITPFTLMCFWFCQKIILLIDAFIYMNVSLMVLNILTQAFSQSNRSFLDVAFGKFVGRSISNSSAGASKHSLKTVLLNVALVIIPLLVAFSGFKIWAHILKTADTNVVAAKHAIAAGSEIKADDIVTVPTSRLLAGPGPILHDVRQAIGRHANRDIGPTDPIFTVDISAAPASAKTQTNSKRVRGSGGSQ
jgi:serine/threonine protein kinase